LFNLFEKIDVTKARKSVMVRAFIILGEANVYASTDQGTGSPAREFGNQNQRRAQTSCPRPHAYFHFEETKTTTQATNDGLATAKLTKQAQPIFTQSACLGNHQGASGRN
jgi:hypothetical protein